MRTHALMRERSVRSHLASSLTSLLLAAALSLLAFDAAQAGSVAYTYDSLGRVATVIYTSGATTTTITYSYDAAGNRTAVVTTSP